MKLSELAKRLKARLQGDGEVSVQQIASLHEAGPNDISFVSDVRYARQVCQTKAAAVVVPEDFDEPANTAILFVADVNEAMEQLLSVFAPPPDKPEVGVHPLACVDPSVKLAKDVAVGASAVIGPGASLGEGSVISAGCVIGRSVRIGKNCHLWPNVVINQNCILGNNVTIHANSTIGMDGFGYRMVAGRHRKIPHIGIVVIEDDVEIGANSCVDRAKFGRTVVGQGTKIDNLVQIAHNVRIGQNCILAAQVGMAGSSELGNYVVFGGQVGVGDHVKVGDGVMAGARAALVHDVEPGAKVMGFPAQSFRDFYRGISLVRKLPEIVREIKQLRKQISNDAAETKDHS